MNVHKQASSRHELPHDAPGTPRRHRDRDVTTEHDHDYDNHDNHDYVQTCGHLWSAGSPPAVCGWPKASEYRTRAAP